MTVSSGAASVFDWFQTLTTITSLFTWVSILIAYLRFRAAMAAQGVNRNTDLVFRSRFQPYTAYGALAFFIIIILFNGFAVFTHNAKDGSSNWDVQSFVTAYVGIPIYLGFYLFWKILKRTKFVKPHEADIWSGKAALDAEVWPEVVPKNWIERVWFWIT